MYNYKPLDHMNNLMTQIDEEKSAKKKRSGEVIWQMPF